MNVMLMSHINPKQTRTYWLTVERDTHTRTYVRIYEKNIITQKNKNSVAEMLRQKTIQPNSMEFRLKCLNYGNVFVIFPIE